MRISDASTNALAQSMAPKLEHKRSVASPRLVKGLGADARMATNDEDETVDRGPLTLPAELSEEDAAAAFPVESATEYAQRKARENVRRASDLDLQQLDVMRKVGAL